MKPKDRIQYLRTHLRPLALATAMGAAMLFGTGTQARADLVGHWFSGAENMSDTSEFTDPSLHDGVAVGNVGGLSYDTELPPGFTDTALRSLNLSNGAAVQISNTATSDAGYANTFDGGSGSTITIAFWAKGFPGDWSPWIAKGGEGLSPGYGWQVRRIAGSSGAGFTVRGVPNDNGGDSPINVNDANWHHFAAVWDASTATRTLYVDGVFSHALTAPGDTFIQSPGNHLIIGGRQTDYPNLSHFYTGKLFDVRIYNNALAQEDVVDLIPLAAPQGLVAAPGTGRVNLSWTPVPLATEYTVSTTPSLGGTPVTDIVTEPFLIKEPLTNGVSYDFKVLATKEGSGSGPYSAVVSATPGESSAKDILAFEFDGLGPAAISGNNIIKFVPGSVNLENLFVYYTVSPFAREDDLYPSGTGRDFSTPQTYTITAEDDSTKAYTVAVIHADPITYNFNDGVQSWTQFWPVTGTLPLWQDWNTGGIGTPEGPRALSDDAESRFGRSPAFHLDNSGSLTFQLAGGRGSLAAPPVGGPSAIPKNAVQNGGFAGVALRDVDTNTYVLSKRRSENGGGYQNGSFTEAELAPYIIPNKRYTLDFIDYNKGDWGWTRLDNVSIPGTIADPEIIPPAANITSVNFPNEAAISGTSIILRALPFGSSVTALAPTYTLSDGATADKPSGSVQNFTNPVVYTITSSDSAIIKQYTVSVSVMPDPASALVGHWVSGAESLADTSGYAPGVHNGVAVGNAASLAYSSDVPAGFSGKSLDLSAGNVAVMIQNSATTDGAGYQTTFDDQSRNQISVAFWAKGFPGEWSPWVAKGGEGGAGWQVRRVALDPVAGFTVRGLGNEDHGGSSVNVNNNDWHHFVGVWDQITGVRSLYVDGVLSHDVNTLGDVMNMATGQHLVLGGRQTDGVNFSNYFAGKLYDVRIYKQKLFAPQVQAIMAPSAGAFTAWINTNYPALPDKASGADPDGDGMTNFEEFAFGLDPGSGASVNPITELLNKVTGTFKYTRLAPGVSGLTYTVKTSTNLVDWATDAAATAGQTVFATNDDVQTMAVTLTATPGEKTVFVRVEAQ
ncbi:LamG-like jellyroll fold domain-containing protein [Luteolibacter sp. Populi]|uniref:LamG-like jellyroll fold domain-containing protein n=1 Tax=Luteolibacter sp. Populi TaxID=3230487 RepID=UPI00346626BE